ncbi:MAG TPA: 50S ribosomal protein L35 [Anaerolineae bacterium]|nr:50S ribosomal protein L35 [Anaerolineae bacterium]HID84494.1 50S ribosomal protein L35 [Anaerolineales bacterium]HIQ08732.1 50S ribosomal protein L35 [Anaerolineaceae bacterium]
MPRKQRTGKKYKIKTHKATAKRFRVTGSGKIVRTKGGKSHFRRRTSDRTKRLFTRMIPVEGAGYIRNIKRLAPYLKKQES